MVPPSPYNTPGRRRELETSNYFQRQATGANSSLSLVTYTTPIHYPVSKTGFYCVGMFIINAMETKLVVDFFTSCNTHYRPVPINSPGRQSPSIVHGLRIV